MDQELVLSIIGVIASVVALIRYLISAYFKKADEHEKLKNSLTVQEIKELREITDELKSKLNQTMEELKQTSEDLKAYKNLYSRAAQELENLNSGLADYVRQSKEKFKKIETDVENLGKVIIVKSGADAKKRNK